MRNCINIEVLEDAEALARRAVALFVSAAHEAITARGAFYVAIPGGTTPQRFFQFLAEDPQAIPWSKVHVFWTDERYVPSDRPENNYRWAADTFLSRVPIPQSHVHRVSTEEPTLCDAVRTYDQRLREAFQLRADQIPRFDLVLLGMGTDGHTASLFPYSYAVMDSRALVCGVRRLAGQPNRVTLTGPVLRGARRVVVLISGKEKAAIFKAVLTAPLDPLQYPIHVLWPVLDRVRWMVDRPAADGVG